jgi:hypothetical protein
MPGYGIVAWAGMNYEGTNVLNCKNNGLYPISVIPTGLNTVESYKIYFRNEMLYGPPGIS